MKEVDVQKQTQRTMALKWILQILVQYEIILMTSPSITGVTYRDHFDFEERYTDANECNPFYWHPLHLPPKCAHFFEKAIRKRLAGSTGKRIVKKQKKKHGHDHSNIYPEELYNPSYPFYEMASVEYAEYPLSPQEELINILKKDIEKDPNSPTVTVMPNFGLVALYKQFISKKSENKLKAMAKAYAKAGQKMYEKYYPQATDPSDTNLFVYDGSENGTTTTKPKNGDKNVNKNKVHRVRTKKGNVVTIIETKNLEAMKNEGFWP